MKSLEVDFLTSAALIIEQQALDNPGIGIPVDPDLADFMGAFEGQENTGDVVATNFGGPDHDH